MGRTGGASRRGSHPNPFPASHHLADQLIVDVDVRPAHLYTSTAMCISLRRDQKSDTPMVAAG
jgi:hypothetical protein